MKMLTKKVLAAKVVLVFALTAPGVMTPAQAGIPVIDGANLTQTVMSAVENVAQTLKQIEQYRTQLQQYENMIQNTVAPAAYIWDQATSTMKPGIASCFQPSEGTHQEWMTSSAVMTKRTLVPVGMTSGRSTSSR